MADPEDTDAGPGAEAADNGPDYATLARLAKLEHPREKARLWALGTLAAAGWRPDNPRPPFAWAEAEGYERGSDVMNAAELAELLDAAGRITRMIEAGRPGPGATTQSLLGLAFGAGYVWGLAQAGRFTAIGEKVWRRGRAGGTAHAEHELHGRILAENARLLAERPGMSERSRARAITSLLGADVSDTTIRSFLRRRRHKKPP